jgi:hypothetical protein
METRSQNERPLADRMDEVPALLDQSDALFRMALADEEAARAIGFGSDRAVSYRKQADTLAAEAAAIQQAAFASFGNEVPAEHVPALVRQYGPDAVWTFGYGDEPDFFTTIGDDDLWAFEGEDADPEVVKSWAPFRLDFDHTPFDPTTHEVVQYPGEAFGRIAPKQEA